MLNKFLRVVRMEAHFFATFSGSAVQDKAPSFYINLIPVDEIA